MPDQIKICTNCKNPFVYSEYEQALDQKRFLVHSSQLIDNSKNQKLITNNQELPQYCPICASIKASEQKHPRKPQKSN